jgi:hypothetical protein
MVHVKDNAAPAGFRSATGHRSLPFASGTTVVVRLH